MAIDLGSINLDRIDLAQFLPNQRAIKAFENLSKAVGVTLPDAIDEVAASADTAAARVAVAEGIALLALQIARDLFEGPPPAPVPTPDQPDDLSAQVFAMREQIAVLTAAVAELKAGPTP